MPDSFNKSFYLSSSQEVTGSQIELLFQVDYARRTTELVRSTQKEPNEPVQKTVEVCQRTNKFRN